MASQAVDIGLRVGVMRIQSLFRSHIVNRAHQLAVLGERLAANRLLEFSLEPCKTHIENLDGSVLIEEQIGGFDVAMDNTFFMGVSEAVGHLEDVIRAPCRR